MSGYIYEAHFECHDILMLGKSPIKWWQRPDMTTTVDWDVKHQFKQTNKQAKYRKIISVVMTVNFSLVNRKRDIFFVH